MPEVYVAVSLRTPRHGRVGAGLLGGMDGVRRRLEGALGISGEPIANLDEVLPYAVIGLGVLLVALSFLGGGRRAERRRERGAR